MIGPWLHADDPLTPLHLEENIDRLRVELDKGPFFENSIRRFLLNDPHRVTLTLFPDETLQHKQGEQIANRLKAIADELSDADKQTIVSEAADLKQTQETVENLSCLPTLTLR